MNKEEKMTEMTDLRPSPIAGQWYPGNPKKLADSVDTYIAHAKLPDLPGKVIGVISPHAGHIYSGPVAGYAFAAVKGMSPARVIVVSPMHHAYSAAVLTSAHQGYSTPLGAMEIDRPAIDRLSESLTKTTGIGLTTVRDDPEHSLEIELPFLQRALAKPFKLIPVMLRAQEPALSKALGKALAVLAAEEETLLVASTDLSHFYDQDTAAGFDQVMLSEFESMSPEGIFRTEFDGTGFACGMAAVAAVLWAALDLGADAVKVLKYGTSGDVTGDPSSVVGYGAAAILKST
jgi:AmmeMemoRadiSam system protein B